MNDRLLGTQEHQLDTSLPSRFNIHHIIHLILQLPALCRCSQLLHGLSTQKDFDDASMYMMGRSQAILMEKVKKQVLRG